MTSTSAPTHNKIKTVGELKAALANIPDTTPFSFLDIEGESRLELILVRHWTKETIEEEAEYTQTSIEDVRDSMMNDGIEEDECVMYIQNDW